MKKLFIVEKSEYKSEISITKNYSLYKKFLWFKIRFIEKCVTNYNGLYRTDECHFLYNTLEKCEEVGEKYILDSIREYKGHKLHRCHNDMWICYDFTKRQNNHTYYIVGGEWSKCEQLIDNILFEKKFKIDNEKKKIVKVLG